MLPLFLQKAGGKLARGGGHFCDARVQQLSAGARTLRSRSVGMALQGHPGKLDCTWHYEELEHHETLKIHIQVLTKDLLELFQALVVAQPSYASVRCIAARRVSHEPAEKAWMGGYRHSGVS